MPAEETVLTPVYHDPRIHLQHAPPGTSTSALLSGNDMADTYTQLEMGVDGILEQYVFIP